MTVFMWKPILSRLPQLVIRTDGQEKAADFSACVHVVKWIRSAFSSAIDLRANSQRLALEVSTRDESSGGASLGPRGALAPLANENSHYVNSKMDTVHYCSKRVAPPHLSKIQGQAPPLVHTSKILTGRKSKMMLQKIWELLEVTHIHRIRFTPIMIKLRTTWT